MPSKASVPEASQTSHRMMACDVEIEVEMTCTSTLYNMNPYSAENRKPRFVLIRSHSEAMDTRPSRPSEFSHSRPFYG